MKIFTSQAIKQIDKATCNARNIDSLELMEQAASAISVEIMSKFRPGKRIVVIAGPGNNGGDALATARMLIEQGFRNIEIFLFNVKGKLSHDCDEERKRLITLDNVDFTEVTREFSPPDLSKNDVVLDGLFGSGLREPLQGGFKSLVEYVNESGAYVVSIDVPSGMFGEWNSECSQRYMIHADLTLAIEFPRLSFFFKEYEHVLGEIKYIDLELDAEAKKTTPTDFYLIEEKEIKNVLRPRAKFSCKRDYGSVLMFAGSMGMMGAAVMASKAAMRAGAGLVTVHSARTGMNTLQTAMPEVMFEPDRSERNIVDMRIHHDHRAVAVGPGIGVYDDTINALEGLLKNSKNPLVLDADALNCIARRPALLTMIPTMSVITPHAGEFDRLFGEHLNSEERLQKAIEMAQYYKIIIVLKGRYTAVIRPDGDVYFNPTGNPGMATAGSGDVLTGVIAAFISQGYKPEMAAAIGVFVHGKAGDIAAEKVGEFGLIATDIIDNIGIAIRQIFENKNN